MNTPHARTIIILGTVLFFIGIITAVVLFMREKNAETPPPPSESTHAPTGIIVPTTQIQQGELDVISVSPLDGSTKISQKQVIKITFSRAFKKKEIEFLIGPESIFIQEIKENILTVRPVSGWTEGTYHTFTVNFPQDLEKVRLYHFTTDGTPAETLPDTRDEALLNASDEKQREQSPDVYLSNQAPFQNDTFSIRYEFEPTVRAHFYFIVTPKTSNQEQVQQSLNAWMQFHGLSQEQIQTLDIRYQ